MSPKSAGKATATKKESVKKESKKETVPAHGESAKAEKKSAKAIEPESDESNEEVKIDQDELEEQEEEVAANNSSAGQSGNAAALAAAAGSSSEMSASFKNFRHHPDMENFYRFIYENDLRHEALAIIDDIIADKAEKKLGKPGKSQH
ncbi:MAG: hypothetical protein ABI041_13215 [Bdellovibrionia bacterium]